VVSPALAEVAARIAAKEPTPGGRIARALAYVRQEIRMLDGPLGLGQRPTPPGEVIEAGAGDALARAALLWHLLRSLGLPARPVFTGPALGEAQPGLAAFDRVLVEVGGRCHSVDPPQAARDRALADAPLGLTLAPGIVDLEPLSPWQPAPEGEKSTSEPSPAPPPSPKTTPPASVQPPVQVEFFLDFASPATARAAQVEAVLLGANPVVTETATPVASGPPPIEPAQSSPAVTVPGEEAKVEEQVAATPAPTPAAEAKPTVPRRSLREQLLERARLHRQASAPPTPPRPAAGQKAMTALEPAAPETGANLAAPVLQPGSEEAVSASTSVKDAAAHAPEEVPAPPSGRGTETKPTLPRRSLREELAARAERQPVRTLRQNPSAVTRPNPRPQRDEAIRTDYDFDPTVRARRNDRAGQFKVALMMLGFLAVVALWIFVFLSKRSAP
jgi:hypothetical protein